MSKGNPGMNQLANVLSNRSRQYKESIDETLDFGQIQSNGSLITNKFPVPIPKTQYSICKGARARIERGSRVLVGWVADEPVVIDAITSSSDI